MDNNEEKSENSNEQSDIEAKDDFEMPNTSFKEFKKHKNANEQVYDFKNDPEYIKRRKEKRKKQILVAVGVILLVIIGIPLLLFGVCILIFRE